MTAHRMAIACSMAALAMGTIDRTEAFDDRSTPAHVDGEHGADRKAQRPVLSAALHSNLERRNGASDAGPRAAPRSLFNEVLTATQQAEFVGASLDQLRAREAKRTDDKRKNDQARSEFLPYAGLGFSKVKLSMDLDSRRVTLKKDRGYSQPRVILGMGYTLTESVSLGMEYRALAGAQPLFSPDTYTGLTGHNVFLTGRYRF